MSALTKLLVALVGLVVAVLLCEAMLRVAWHNPYANESSRPVVFLRMHPPRTDHRYDRSIIDTARPEVRFRTDARSYVVPARREGTPDATVLFLGGSTTECEIVAENLRFPAMVADLLAERGLRVDSLNGAHAGNTVQDSLNVLLNHAIADRPDVAVMMHAANDAGLLAEDHDYARRMARGMTGSDVVRWLAQQASSRFHLFGLLRRASTTAPVDRIAERARPLDRAAALAEIGQFRARVRAFVALARALGVEPVLMTQPLAPFRTELTPPWVDVGVQPAYNDVIREVAAESDVVVVDLVRHLEENVPGWDQPMVVFYDGMHVTDGGSEIYARLIAERLETEVVRPLVAARRHVDAPPSRDDDAAGRPLVRLSSRRPRSDRARGRA